MSAPPGPSRTGLLQSSGERFSFADAVGGTRGILDSVVPGVVFLLVFTATRDLRASVWAAVAVGAVLAVARLVRRETLQHALAGFIGVALCAAFASRTGRAENFFLPGLLVNAGYAGAYLVSIVLRWPLLGVFLGVVTGEGTAWRRDPARLRAYTQASWIWVAMFLLRLLVQYPLWKMGAVTALGVARLAMGFPMFGLAALLSWLILRRVPPARPEPADVPDDPAR